MDIIKYQIITAIGVSLKEELTPEKLNLSRDIANEIEIHKITNTSYMVHVRGGRGPRHFEVKVTEKM